MGVGGGIQAGDAMKRVAPLTGLTVDLCVHSPMRTLGKVFVLEPRNAEARAELHAALDELLDRAAGDAPGAWTTLAIAASGVGAPEAGRRDE